VPTSLEMLLCLAWPRARAPAQDGSAAAEAAAVAQEGAPQCVRPQAAVAAAAAPGLLKIPPTRGWRQGVMCSLLSAPGPVLLLGWLPMPVWFCWLDERAPSPACSLPETRSAQGSLAQSAPDLFRHRPWPSPRQVHGAHRAVALYCALLQVSDEPLWRPARGDRLTETPLCASAPGAPRGCPQCPSRWVPLLCPQPRQ